MHERIKEHNRDIRLAGTQASTVSKHANKTGRFPIWNKVNVLYATHTGTLVGLKRPST